MVVANHHHHHPETELLLNRYEPTITEPPAPARRAATSLRNSARKLNIFFFSMAVWFRHRILHHHRLPGCSLRQ